jgi:hypothetical protein
MLSFRQWFEAYISATAQQLANALVKDPLNNDLRMVLADALEESGDTENIYALRSNDPIYHLQYFQQFVNIDAPPAERRRIRPNVVTEIFTWDNLIKYLRSRGLVHMNPGGEGSWSRQDQYLNGHRNHTVVIRLTPDRPLPPFLRNLFTQILGTAATE